MGLSFTINVLDVTTFLMLSDDDDPFVSDKRIMLMRELGRKTTSHPCVMALNVC